MRSDATGTCDLHPFKEMFFTGSNALREGVRGTRKTAELVAIPSALPRRGDDGGPANLDVNYI